jgi:MFS family permease
MKWMIGFFFHDMAFGLLSVFLPLYIFFISGSLIWIGIMSAMAMFLSIPSSFLWGNLCDKIRRYKIFVLISFLFSSILLYFFTLTNQVIILVILYVIMVGIFDIAYEPSKNILIAELYPYEEWKKTYAFYEGFTDTGFIIGLFSGFLALSYGFSSKFILLICSGFLFLAFLTSIFLVEDPILIIERRRFVIERTAAFICKGFMILSKIISGGSEVGKLKRENMMAFLFGITFFFLSTNMLFTLMPIFINNMASAIGLPSSIVYIIYIMNTFGIVIGALFIRRRENISEVVGIRRAILFRALLALLLILTIKPSLYSILFITVILTLSGFTYVIYLVNVISISVGILSKGKVGLFNTCERIGSGIGSLISPIIVQLFGFSYLFLISSIIFIITYITLRIFTCY